MKMRNKRTSISITDAVLDVIELQLMLLQMDITHLTKAQIVDRLEHTIKILEKHRGNPTDV